MREDNLTRMMVSIVGRMNEKDNLTRIMVSIVGRMNERRQSHKNHGVKSWKNE